MFILKVIHKHFYLKRVEIMAQCEEWIADIQQYSSDKRVGRTMSHHAAALKVRKPPTEPCWGPYKKRCLFTGRTTAP